MTFAVFCASGCGRSGESTGQKQPDSYASREPGSDAAPTSDESFELLAADGPTRFATLQALIVRAGHPCRAVTRGVLEGGMDGTDEWRVDCSDSGRWQIWFRADGGQDVDKCANAQCS